MKCPRCKAEIPEGKIYCENCGAAIQMVPDYNPVDDITIGTATKKKVSEVYVAEEKAEAPALVSQLYRFRYGLAGICLAVLGVFIFHASYQAVARPEQAVVETPQMPLLLNEPQFNIKPGVYDYSPRITISHEERTDGLIYYTTDGTTPTADSTIYNSPIQLEEGTTVIRAVFIRSDGMQSEEADGTYEVVFDYPDEPVFSVPAGSYSGGFQVVLTSEPDCRIYYTTNGEEPGLNSSVYNGPVDIPVGLTVLQAVAVDAEGGTSGIVEAIYNVEEDITPQETNSGQMSGMIP